MVDGSRADRIFDTAHAYWEALGVSEVRGSQRRVATHGEQRQKHGPAARKIAGPRCPRRSRSAKPEWSDALSPQRRNFGEITAFARARAATGELGGSHPFG